MNGKITYHQQVSYCGKPHCRRCREGTGHGPYWYAYQVVNGRTTRTYVGKHLPPDVQAAMEGTQQILPSIHTSEREQATIRMYTLGQFRLERRDGSGWQTITESAWQHQRVRALLTCLVSSGTRKLGREQLMEALWPDLDRETASHRLDRAVHSLRQVLEPTRSKLATSPLLLTEREILVLAGHPLVWIDADAFEHLLAQAHACANPGETERLLEAAAALYGGDFLPEERSLEWTFTRREKLQRSWLGLLLELADLRIARDALTNAIDTINQLLAIDPANEGAVQRLISLLARQGRRGEALRIYKRFVAILQQEYRIAPLPETRALYDAVRLGDEGRGERTGMNKAAAYSRGDPGGRPTLDSRSELSARPIQIGRVHQTPLVGREQELEFLHDLVLTTENATKFKLPGQKKLSSAPFDLQRRPQAVLLMGDVGIGKTRLAEEVSREAKRRGWAIAWSRVYAQESSIPYRVWTEALRKAMEQSRIGAILTGALPPQFAQRPSFYQPLSMLLPELRGVLPEVAFLSPSPPEQEQLRIWSATYELLISISEETPLLIVLDDLQWADGRSCELLAYLARRIHGHPINIVATCRDNEIPADSPLRSLVTDLQREHAFEPLSLQPLSDEQIGALVSQILVGSQSPDRGSIHWAHVPSQPEPMVTHIQTHAAGNPFFAEELARGIATQPLAPLTPDSIASLPDTITAVLDLRLSRLSSACQRLLSRAAVLGSSFAFPLICSMEANTPSSSEDTVLELLEEALHAGMLTEEGTGTRITYHFWHPLLVNHLYESLSAARCASLHRRAADALRQAYANREEEGAAIITQHLLLGGADAQLIVRYAELAGDRAYSLSAYPDAEKYYKIVVEHIGIAGERDELLHLSYVLERLAESVTIQGKNKDARHFYEQVIDIHSQFTPVSSAEHTDEAQINALLWYEIGRTWYNVGDIAKAREFYKLSERVLREAGIVSGPVWAKLCFGQSYAFWREGNYEEARRRAQDALKLFEETLEQQRSNSGKDHYSTRISRILAGDPVDLGRTHALLGIISSAGGGQLTDAVTHLNTALTLYEQHSRQREIASVSCNLGDVHLRRAEHELAQANFRRSLTLAERIGEIPLQYVVLGNLGVLATRFGNLMEAEDSFRQGVVLAEQLNDPVYLSVLHIYLAVVLQEQGRFSEAGKSLLRALAISRARHITPCVGQALVASGNMRLMQALLMRETTSATPEEAMRVLKRARGTLQHALLIKGQEAETRTEGQLIMAHVSMLVGEMEVAHQQATHALEEARRFELMWLIARAQSLLGSISTIRGQHERADEYFEQALRMFRRSEMKLARARTLQQYGVALVQRDSEAGNEYQLGLAHLQEARQLFKECNAALDLQLVEHELSKHEQTVMK